MLFLSYPIHVVVESAEHPPYVITIRVLSGNLKQLEGRYQIERTGSGDDYVLHWSGVIEPAIALPTFITVPLMRANIENQFAGMLREIERRNALRTPSPAHAAQN